MRKTPCLNYEKLFLKKLMTFFDEKYKSVLKNQS